jgi:hypothetical protein
VAGAAGSRGRAILLAKTDVPSTGEPCLRTCNSLFRNGEFRQAGMQTDPELRKNPHEGFVQTFESGEMHRNFPVKRALVVGIF